MSIGNFIFHEIVSETAFPITFSHSTSFAVGLPRMVFVAVGGRGIATEEPSGVTYGGVTMTEIHAARNVANELQYLHIYSIANDSVPSPGSNTVSISYTGYDAGGINGFAAVLEIGNFSSQIIDSDTFDVDGSSSCDMSCTSRSEDGISLVFATGTGDPGTITYPDGQTVLYGAFSNNVFCIVSYILASSPGDISHDASFSASTTRCLGYNVSFSPFVSIMSLFGGM